MKPLLCLLAFFSLSSVLAQEFRCPESNGNFENPSDAKCVSYYECNNFAKKWKECPKGFKFHPHPSMKRCLLEDSVDCKDSNPFVCPVATANVADPKNCSRFYYCSNGAPLHRTCSTGQIFIESQKSCQPGNPSQCGNNAIITCPELNGNFANSSDMTCRKYFSCSNGKATQLECPLDYRFHPYPTMRRCLVPDSVDCNSQSPFVCHEGNGDFADPHDCRRFYSCQNFAPLHRRCPENQIFREIYKNCSAGNPNTCDRNGGLFECPSNGNFEDSSDETCTHYFSCSMGQASHVSCPNGLRFHPHPNMRRCLLADSVDCKPSNPFMCLGANSDYQDPNNCQRYYSCQNWVPLHRTCDPGNVFVERNKRCEAGSNCNSSASYFVCPSSEGHFPDKNDRTCRKFYVCTNNSPKASECSAGMRYHPHPSLQRCVIESSYDCNDPHKFVCPVNNADVRDPYSCARFYSCQNGAPLHRSCEPGLTFSPNLRRCVSSSTCQSFSCPKDEGMYPDPNDDTCSHYFDCGSDEWKACQEGFRFHWHPNMRRCVLADSVDCNSNPFKCPAKNQDVPDPTDRTRFYSCQNWVPLHRTCTQGQKFSSTIRRCE